MRQHFVGVLLIGAILLVSTGQIALAQQSKAVNRGVVELETSSSAGISVRIAEDLANLVDDGATRRVVPVVGRGSLQNLTDLKYLRGIDLAIMSIDVLDYAKTQQLAPGIENSITYVTRLYHEEFHLLAGANIKTISDLANQKVNIDVQGSSTSITATRLFNILKIPVVMNNDPQEVAIEKLRSGAVSAIAFLAAKPAPLFQSINQADGLHLIDIPFDRLTQSSYIPTKLTEADYPALMPEHRSIETVAVGTVLLVADLHQVPERYRNVSNFTEVFFTGFQNLLSPGHHPKWSEVNLAAELPGWRRFAPADQWLQRNKQVAGTPNPDELQAMFSRFVDERRKAVGGTPMTSQEKNNLFQQFRAWQSGQAR